MTMLVHGYKSKKELAACVGQRLNYEETSLFGSEFKPDGKNTVAHRPLLIRDPKARKGAGREFFAVVHCSNGLITKVE